jgi:hypothetical protein
MRPDHEKKERKKEGKKERKKERKNETNPRAVRDLEI